MSNQSEDFKQDNVPAVTSRRDALVAGSVLVVAPFMGGVASTLQAAQTANTGGTSSPANSSAGNVRSPTAEWTSYAGDKASTKYSPIAQIDGANFNRLKVAWTWRSPEEAFKEAHPEMRTWV